MGGAAGLFNLGTGNTFATESVGSCSARVLRFPQGNGLGLIPSGLFTSTTHYSIVILARLNGVDSYRKLFDYRGGMFDEGFYAHNGALDWYDVLGDDHEGTAALGPGGYAEIAFTVHVVAFDLDVVGYVNGVEKLGFHKAGSVVFPVVSGDLRFFIDDEVTGDEETGGAVSRIRVYDGTLSADEVAAIHGGSVRPPVCQSSSTGRRAAALKKCKQKAKQKHWSKKRLKKCKRKAKLLPV